MHATKKCLAITLALLTITGPAAAAQDLRTPDARDAAATPAEDLRSPDARAADTRQPELRVPVGITMSDLRTPDAVDAGRPPVTAEPAPARATDWLPIVLGIVATAAVTLLLGLALATWRPRPRRPKAA